MSYSQYELNSDAYRKMLRTAFKFFTTYGCKSASIEGILAYLSIHKKNLPKHLLKKEQLLEETLNLQISDIQSRNNLILSSSDNSLQKIALISKNSLDLVKNFHPSFIHELQKYYPKLYANLERYIDDVIFNHFQTLLHQSQGANLLRKDLNIELICEMFLLEAKQILERKTGLIEKYGTNSIVNQIIINHLRGLILPDKQHLIAYLS